MRALADFKEGKLQLLVATDIAARGLDIEQLPHVINYELPHNPEDYIHRIGRTGRAGQPGDAISLVAPDEEELLASIERLLKTRITISAAPDAGRSGRRGTNDRESERPGRRPASVRESGHSERRPPRERRVDYAVPEIADAEYVTPPRREPDRRPDERPAALVNRPGAAAGGPARKAKREIPALFLPPVVEKQGN
jgi:ATP-dependent RNA helicase RhlE